MFKKMRRGAFILISTATAITVLLPIANCSAQPSMDNIMAYPSSLSLIMSSNSINKIGKKYNQIALYEADKKILLSKLLPEKYIEKNNSSSDIFRIQNSLKHKIKKDYKKNDTIIIDGWILSKTEVRQCALFALINK